MSSLSLHLWGLVILAGACVLATATAQAQAGSTAQVSAPANHPPLPELWTRLDGKLDSTKLKSGDPIRAVVSQAWVYGTCGVQEGSKLDGTVLATPASPDPKAGAQVSLSFTATCSGTQHKRLILIALYYAGDEGKSQMDLYNSMPQGLGAGASGRQSTDPNRLPSSDAGNTGLPLARMGEVKGIRHLSLDVDKDSTGSTTIVSTEKHLHLDAGTRLVFVPAPDKD